MARKSAIETQQEHENELVEYLRVNGPVEYKQAYANVSTGAMQQYRRLKHSGVIRASVGPDGNGNISHTIELIGEDE